VPFEGYQEYEPVVAPVVEQGFQNSRRLQSYKPENNRGQRRSSIDQTPPEEDFVIEAILANEDL